MWQVSSQYVYPAKCIRYRLQKFLAPISYKHSLCLQLTNEERVAIARRVVDKSGGRVPVVVGATFEGGLEEQAGLMREMGQFSDAVVIITNQIAAMEEVRRELDSSYLMM